MANENYTDDLIKRNLNLHTGYSICLRCKKTIPGILMQGLCPECKREWWNKIKPEYFKFIKVT